MNTLGEYISEHRNKKRFSVRKLAELAQISHTEVHRIENGERANPSPSILKALSGPLDVPYDELMKVAGYLEQCDSKNNHDVRIKHIDTLTSSEIEEVNSFIEFLLVRRNKKTCK